MKRSEENPGADDRSTAVHFGAGNIGRGFIGPLLLASGYRVVFVDVSPQLVDSLNSAGGYTVWELAEAASSLDSGKVSQITIKGSAVTGFSALQPERDREQLLATLAQAEIVTTAVGVNILPQLAPLLVEVLRLRAAAARPPLPLMACENAVDAALRLREAVLAELSAAEGEQLAAWALFCPTAVDRVVPDQSVFTSPDLAQLGLSPLDFGPLDVGVESYFEWVADRSVFPQPFFPKQRPLPLAGVSWVDDLTPYIERKLLTVNTGHAALAYAAHRRGYTDLAAAAADPDLLARVAGVLGETARFLAERHGWDAAQQQEHIGKTLARFRVIPDGVARVARSPLRKLSASDRFLLPAAALAERGYHPEALLGAVADLLRFYDPADPEAVQLRSQLRELAAGSRDAGELTKELTGLSPSSALFPALVAEMAAAAREIS